MKKFNKYKTGIVMLSAFVAITASSCRKQLFQEPYTSLSPDAAFATPDRVEKAAIGMYDQLQNRDFFGGHVLIYVDIRGIDVNPPTYFGPMPTFTQVNATDGTVGLGWAGGYRSIGEANLFLKNLAGAQGVTPAKIAQYTGEAEFIRSLNYFYLVNLWAQPYGTLGATQLGVPLVLTSSDAPFDASNQVPRATVAAVYAQLEKDLLDAEAKLPVNYSEPSFSDVARATKGAAQALLARVYLYEHKYTEALAYANKVIAGGYSLNNDPVTPFRTYTTKESIFSVANNGADNPNTNWALGQHYNPTLRGDIQVSDNYVSLMDTLVDLRYKNLIIKTGTGTSSVYWSGKYQGVTDWVPVLRYSETLLIKAEALANLAGGVDGDAVKLVNQVRSRSHAANIAPTTKTDLITAILTERRIELAFEGQGEFDFLRTGRGIPAHSVVDAQAYGSNYVVLPIPKYDTDKNPNLVQNPGY
jgi:hypothetical protein